MKKLSDFSLSVPVKKENRYGKVLAGIITSIVIGLLVIAGPVDALFLGISGLKVNYDFNEKVNFIGEIDINSNEIVNIQNVSVEVNDRIVCTFDVSGVLLSSCKGVNVSLISNNATHGYGYGYNSFQKGWKGDDRSSNAGNWNGSVYGYGNGFGNGEISYNVTIQTPQDYLRIPGENDIQLVANSETQTFNSRTEHIVIRPQNSGGNGGNNGRGGGNGRGSGGEEGGRRNNNNNGQGNGPNSLGNNRNNDQGTLEQLTNIFGDGNSESNNPITGAVIGTNRKGIIGIFGAVLFIIIIAVATFLVNQRRKRSYQKSLY